MIKYFTLEEMCASPTAVKKGLQNIPSFEIVRNIEYLCSVLDMVREDWGAAIVVSSGFRNKIVNAAVGGVKNSGHLTGLAADLLPLDMSRYDEFKEFLKDWFTTHTEIDFDQLIEESSGNSKWCHLSLNGSRRQIFEIKK